MIPSQIGNFNLYDKEPNTICAGYLYTLETKIGTIVNQKERTIRVYLPSNYDFLNPKKRFPVIYMMDGANLVDKYTSFAGEWEIDETIESRIHHKQKSFIVVGIDCPHNAKERTCEMMPPNNFSIPRAKAQGKPGADVFGEWIIKDLKALIDQTFFTLTDKENTAVGGSSMGGLMAYYLGMKFPEIVGFSLCFSPAFMLFQKKAFSSYLKKVLISPKQYGRFFFYVGGVDFEASFVAQTLEVYNQLKFLGFSQSQIALISDETKAHHESAWSVYFPEAISFWLD